MTEAALRIVHIVHGICEHVHAASPDFDSVDIVDGGCVVLRLQLTQKIASPPAGRTARSGGRTARSGPERRSGIGPGPDESSGVGATPPGPERCSPGAGALLSGPRSARSGGRRTLSGAVTPIFGIFCGFWAALLPAGQRCPAEPLSGFRPAPAAARPVCARCGACRISSPRGPPPCSRAGRR